jgi:hypothetical protein
LLGFSVGFFLVVGWVGGGGPPHDSRSGDRRYKQACAPLELVLAIVYSSS